MQKRARRGVGWAASVAIVGLLGAPAFAQAPPAATPSASPPGAAAPAADAPGDAAKTPPKPPRSAAGYGYRDAPTRKVRAGRAAPRQKSGPAASFPGFVASDGGGSRVLVRLSASVTVEEHRAAGSITYVLKGAHVAHRNDTHALVTVHFNTPVMTARLVPKGGDLHLVIVLRAPTTPTFKLSPTAGAFTLEVDFPKGDFLPPEAGAPGAAAPTQAPTQPTPQPIAPPRTPEPKP